MHFVREIKAMVARFKNRFQEGQGLVEYALIIILVAVVLIALLMFISGSLGRAYCAVVTILNPSTAPNCGTTQAASAAPSISSTGLVSFGGYALSPPGARISA
jgi:Flp pilus assembly pilin Flp